MVRMPDKKIFFTYSAVSLQLTLIFCTIYGFTNWLATQHSQTYRFWMDWELAIPLIPWTVLIYISLNVLTLLPLFTLNAEEIKALGKSMIISTLVAGVVFLVFPAHIGYSRTTNIEFWGPFYDTLYSLDNTANTLPSLHITYSFLVVRAIGHVRIKLREVLWIWFACISVSVVLTHQHHLIDILGGILLGHFCFKKYFLHENFAQQDSSFDVGP